MMEYIIPAAAAVVVAVIEFIAARDRKAAKQQQERTEAHEKNRAEEIRLSMKIQDATLQLGIVTANALTGGHNNGNVQTADKAARDAQCEYRLFLQQITAQEVAKL